MCDKHDRTELDNDYADRWRDEPPSTKSFLIVCAILYAVGALSALIIASILGITP